MAAQRILCLLLPLLSLCFLNSRPSLATDTLPSITVNVTYRDFHMTFPDFSEETAGYSFIGCGGNYQAQGRMVHTTLSADGRPACLCDDPYYYGLKCLTTNDNFNKWYRSTPGVNYEVPGEIGRE